MAKKTEKKGASPKKPPPKASKAKQLKLPAKGMARDRVPELDEAAESYRAARDERMECTKAEKAAKTVLMDVAKKHGIDVYIYESEEGEELAVEYSAETSENITVHKVKAEQDDSE